MRKKTAAGIGLVIALLILGGAPMGATAEDDDYSISGVVYFYNGTDQKQVPDYPVSLTYVPTRERLETMTDQNGYYEFNFADLESGYEEGQYVEIIVEPYISDKLMIPAHEGVIYINPDMQNSYYNIFNIKGGIRKFLYEVSLFLNLQGNAVIPGGLGVWDFTLSSPLSNSQSNFLAPILFDSWTFTISNQAIYPGISL
ncbi:MAG: hypothetical protein QXH42_10080 [Thermoplasmata archaeon]